MNAGQVLDFGLTYLEKKKDFGFVIKLAEISIHIGIEYVENKRKWKNWSVTKIMLRDLCSHFQN